MHIMIVTVTLTMDGPSTLVIQDDSIAITSQPGQGTRVTLELGQRALRPE